MIEQYRIAFIPTDSEICLMCHLSTECRGCCLVCRHQKTCASAQLCAFESDRQIETTRWEAWMSIIENTEYYKTLINKFKKK